MAKFQLSKNKHYMLNTGDVITLARTHQPFYYSWSVTSVNGNVDNFFGERFTDEGEAYHYDCYKIICED
jgi:hypothetical protein